MLFDLSLLVPKNVGKKRRRINEELYMVWEDENDNYQAQEFTEEEGAEWAELENLTDAAAKHRISSLLASPIRTA